MDGTSPAGERDEVRVEFGVDCSGIKWHFGGFSVCSWDLLEIKITKIGEKMLMTGGGLVVISLTPLEGPSPSGRRRYIHLRIYAVIIP